MPTAVLDIDLAKPILRPNRLDAYQEALVLFRIAGRPVGQARVRLIGGQIDERDLHAAAVEGAGRFLRECRVHRYLGWKSMSSEIVTAPPATVVICTRDRPDDLRRCLNALHLLPDDGQELIVVDNAPSTEEARSIVEEHRNVRYIRHDRPGLNSARNRGLREASHEIVAFTDDDAVPDPGWLRAMLRSFDHRLVKCVTGLIAPLELETPAQEAFEDYSPFGRGFERRVFSGAWHWPFAAGAIGAGANMALRRDILRDVGGFDEALDAGTSTRSGGDHEMFSRILLRGYRIVYEPCALSWHRHRRSHKELRDTIYGYGVGMSAAWTRALLVEGDPGGFGVGLRWLARNRLPTLWRSLLRRPGHRPLALVLAELRGCAAGPWAYLASYRRTRSA